MKVGNIVEPNQKGQIVIPKKMRDQLGITPGKPLNVMVRDNGIYMHPITSVNTTQHSKEGFLKILEMTKGSWAGDDWEETEKKRRKIEIKAAKKAKKAW